MTIFKCKSCKKNCVIIQPKIEILLGIKPKPMKFCENCESKKGK